MGVFYPHFSFKMIDLKQITKDIRSYITEYQLKNELTFIEDTHTYSILKDGGLFSDFPSVSKVIKNYYIPFDDVTKAKELSNGDIEKEKQLLKEWKESGDYATNMGSRVHYELEKYLVSLYGDYKEVRKPIFNCDTKQIIFGNKMIEGGKKYIDLMHKRGAVLLDTETILGNVELGYFGQPDKLWLIENKGKVGLVITDWKTNQLKNFEVKPYNKPMLEPFTYLFDTALGKYKIQLPLYGKLFLKMLENSKFKKLKLFGCVIVRVTDMGGYDEYKVEKKVINDVMSLKF